MGFILIFGILCFLVYVFKFNERGKYSDHQNFYDSTATANKSKFVSSKNVNEDAFTRELTNTLEMEIQKLFRKYPREEDDVLLSLFIEQLIYSYREVYEKNVVEISNETNISISKVEEIIKKCTNNCFDKYLLY
ncbi:hypothetical protein VT569_02045 [Flavobacterium psychrophilum]|uniref:hypothetical protein n=1 Tax=Flavobacterium psychrophilum TaxID=96345 RepID=UPI00073F2159|nr:hypothetical protein [Flavobacterium psychrophilum]SNB22020.1 hypothetical protein KU06062604_720015 [Flavobacterium psychrophilum]SNB97174.1 hypothetical protein FPC840_390009 [Flavobacterium psychrophilum]